jgi:acetyl-CoA carboxylase biotin carboxyl carrier protein
MGKLEVDQQLIRDLAAILEETGLTEIEVSDDDNLVRVARSGATVVAQAPTAAPAVAAMPAAAEAPAAAAVFDASHPGAVTSPMVGTAYHAAEPTAPPFVKVGDQVSEGQTVVIIEAMKTFNEIPSPKSGTVKQIMFENQSPVEFGDVLMIIE